MATSRNIDFSNVKDGGLFNKKRIPYGDYLATVTKVEDAKAKDETAQFLFTIKIDKHPTSLLPYYCKLQENQLWKLRNILIAGGLAVPKKKVKVDPNRLVGKKIGVTIEDDEYDGKEQSGIAGVFPASELDDDAVADVEEDDEDVEEEDDNLDDMEDEAEEADDEEDDEDEDPYAAMSRAELKAELIKRDPTFQARKSQNDNDLRALLNAGVADDEDEEEDDEEEEAPPVKVVKRAVKKTAAPVKKAVKKKSVNEVSDEELEELDIDDL